VSSLFLLLLLLPILLISMMAHEVSHGYVAYRLGDPTAKQHGRLTANPIRHLDPLGSMMFIMTYLAGSFIFGWAKPIPVNPYYFRDHQRGMMAVGIAGPAANFAMAVIIAVVLNSLESVISPGSLTFDVLFLAYQVNVVLGIFNLVPIPPLDGSRLLGGFLSPRRYRQWTELDRYGMVFILVIFIFLRGPFFTMLRTAFEFVSRILLPAYFG
jgi:Zn-dependent protease